MVIARNFWQQSAGDTDRDYVEICLQFEVILNGPGHAGTWPGCATILSAEGVAQRKISDLKRFCQDMVDGDIVVLKTGTTDVHAIGVIVGDYQWNPIFSDVDGWDLQHVRRVKWLWKKPNPLSPHTFPTYALKFGDTTQRLNSPDVLQWIQLLNLNYNNISPPIALPVENNPNLSHEAIGEYLFDKGVSSNSIERLLAVIDDLEMIAKWYLKQDKPPSETETKAYLIIPLLRALGWTPQKMAVELTSIDIAIFSRLPRDPNNIIAIVEAKAKGKSCLTAFDQALNYAQGKSSCNRLIVTDGLRYGIFIRNTLPNMSNTDETSGQLAGVGGYILHSYMNLTAFKNEYVIYHCKGICEALWAMTPDWSP